MSYTKIRSFILGIIPMTLIHYFYWNWLIKALTSPSGSLYDPLLIPAVLTLIYCIYEKFIVFPSDATVQDRIPLTILWGLECLIGIILSHDKISNQLPDSDLFIKQFVTIWSPASGCVFICSFVTLRLGLNKTFL